MPRTALSTAATAMATMDATRSVAGLHRHHPVMVGHVRFVVHFLARNRVCFCRLSYDSSRKLVFRFLVPSFARNFVYNLCATRFPRGF